MALLADLVPTSSTLWERRDTTSDRERVILDLVLASADLRDYLVDIARVQPMLTQSARGALEHEARRRFDIARADLESAMGAWGLAMDWYVGAEAVELASGEPFTVAQRQDEMQDAAEQAEDFVDKAIRFGVDGLVDLAEWQLTTLRDLAQRITDVVVDEEQKQEFRAYVAAAEAALPVVIAAVKERTDQARREWGHEIGLGLGLALLLGVAALWKWG